MVENPTIPASRSENRSPTRTWLAKDLEWHLLSPAKRLFLAHVTQRPTTVENGLPLFLAVAQGWHLGTVEPPVTRKSALASWQEAATECQYLGQPIDQDLGRWSGTWF